MQEIIRDSIPLGLTLAAVVTDLRRREVPDVLPAAILAWAIVAKAAGLLSLSWSAMAAGAIVGLAVSGVFYAMDGIGGGDVKLVAALGAVLGPLMLLMMLFWVAMAGGVLAVAAAIRGRKDLAYVPAIAAGLFVQTVWPNALTGVIASLR
jgi:Flp pilus assembly protein protease CpaA